jgi:hypothetical protein
MFAEAEYKLWTQLWSEWESSNPREYPAPTPEMRKRAEDKLRPLALSLRLIENVVEDWEMIALNCSRFEPYEIKANKHQT